MTNLLEYKTNEEDKRPRFTDDQIIDIFIGIAKKYPHITAAKFVDAFNEVVSSSHKRVEWRIGFTFGSIFKYLVKKGIIIADRYDNKPSTFFLCENVKEKKEEVYPSSQYSKTLS